MDSSSLKRNSTNNRISLNETYVVDRTPKFKKAEVLIDDDSDHELSFQSSEDAVSGGPGGPRKIVSSEEEEEEDSNSESEHVSNINAEDRNEAVPMLNEVENVTVHSYETESEEENERVLVSDLDDTDVNRTIDFEGSGDENCEDKENVSSFVSHRNVTVRKSFLDITKAQILATPKVEMPALEEVLSSNSDEFSCVGAIQIDDDEISLSPAFSKKSVLEINIASSNSSDSSDNECAVESFEASEVTTAAVSIAKSKIIPPPKNIANYNQTVSIIAEKRLLGGKMTDERMQKVKAVTEEVISSVHSSLNTAPENELTETPVGLRTELMRHQKLGLSWLLWREKQNPPSGILADDMGLGKTLSMLSLIMEKKNRRLQATGEVVGTTEKLKRRALEGSRLIESHATLIVAPASLIYQWDKEVKDRVRADRLSVHIFHGPKKQRECEPRILARYDIVITTYQTLASELSEKRMLGVNHDDDEDSDDATSDMNSPNIKRVRKTEKKMVSKNSHSPLAKIAWERVILDEAHQIKNRHALASRAVCRLIAVHRWCLTGTPIHNELWDLYSLIRFLRVAPFNEEKMWKDFIMASTRHNTDRLNALVKGLLLRRTKEQICQVTKKPIVKMKERCYEVVTLQLKDLERRCYDIMFAASKQKVRDLLKNQELSNFGISRRHKKPAEVIKNPFLGGSREININDRFQQMSSVLVLLLRLRQACVHMSLTRTGVDLDAFRDIGQDVYINEVKDINQVNILEESMTNLSLNGNELENSPSCAKNSLNSVEEIFQPHYLSTKVEAALSRLQDIIDANDKCVIVSQWTTMLNMLETHLQARKIKYTSITGSILTKDRQERVDSFNRTNGGAQVMLLSLTAGGVGLNLIGGNHLFLLDLHWNPALEQQACDRIYRMGQQKNVFIHKFLCDGTIEKRVLELQENKTALAKSVLEGAAKRGKLTMTDLKFLFELDSRSNAPPMPTTSSQPAVITL